MNKVKRYIPGKVKEFIESRLYHYFIKWNKDLSSDFKLIDNDGMIIVVDLIFRISGSRNTDKNHFVEIPMDYFHKILQNDYKIYLEYLIENKIIFCDNHYITGYKSLGYKINEDFLDDLISIDINSIIYNKRTIKAINEKSQMKVSTKHRNNFLKDFNIDYEKANEYLDYCFFNNIPDHKGRITDKYTRSVIQYKLLSLKDKQLFINRSASNGRINSNLTILNGNYKQFIKGYDYSLDIVASQPTMLLYFCDLILLLKSGGLSSKSSTSISYYLSYEYKIIEKSLGKIDAVRFLEDLKNVSCPDKKELEKWRFLCQDGSLYEYFMRTVYEKTGKKLTRTEAKEMVIVILYSPNKMPNEYKKIFASIFPSIYDFTLKVKSLAKTNRSHRMLSILLQGTESFIWVNNILEELDSKNIKYHFIHDSIIVKEKDLELSEMIIKEQFYKVNIKPSIKIEKIRK